jgi:uncharacterized protein with PIN domain
MMKTARFRFDAGLRSLLQHAHVDGEFPYVFNGPQSAKHLIESVGIPHTEIGAVAATGEPVSAAYVVQDGDTVDVWGNAPESMPPDEPRFVLDGHLGRLNAHLRMLGLDCLYETDYNDQDLVQVGVAEQRIILTRDRRLLMHKSVALGYLVRSLDPALQLQELVHRYGLRRWTRPFQRCIRCNHLLEAVSKGEIIDRLEPLTKLYFNEFRICPGCGQIYWKGSHFESMERVIRGLEH